MSEPQTEPDLESRMTPGDINVLIDPGLVKRMGYVNITIVPLILRGTDHSAPDLCVLFEDGTDSSYRQEGDHWIEWNREEHRESARKSRTWQDVEKLEPIPTLHHFLEFKNMYLAYLSQVSNSEVLVFSGDLYKRINSVAATPNP